MLKMLGIARRIVGVAFSGISSISRAHREGERVYVVEGARRPALRSAPPFGVAVNLLRVWAEVAVLHEQGERGVEVGRLRELPPERLVRVGAADGRLVASSASDLATGP